MKKLRLCLVAAMAAMGLNGAMAQTYTVDFGTDFVKTGTDEDGKSIGDFVVSPISAVESRTVPYALGSDGITLNSLPRVTANSTGNMYTPAAGLQSMALQTISVTDNLFTSGNTRFIQINTPVDKDLEIVSITINGCAYGNSASADINSTATAACLSKTGYTASNSTVTEEFTEALSSVIGFATSTPLPRKNGVGESSKTLIMKPGTKSIIVAQGFYYVENENGGYTLSDSSTEGAQLVGYASGTRYAYIGYISVTYRTIPTVAVIPAAGVTTFSSVTPVSFSDNSLEIYTVSSADEGIAILTPLEGTIPAGEGVIIKGTPGTYEYVDESTSPDAIEGNLLVGCPTPDRVPTMADTKYYILSLNATGDAGSEGFYYYNNGGAGGFTVPAGKAYLPITSNSLDASARLALSFGDGSTTDMETDKVSQDDTTPVDVYSIDGCLIRSNVLPTEALQGLSKGIYIVGGKKVALY